MLLQRSESENDNLCFVLALMRLSTISDTTMSMKLFLTGVSILIISSCGPKIYKAGNFENSRNNIKTVAILPFLVTIDSKRLPKGVTIETLKRSEERRGHNMQCSAYTWLQKRQNEYTTIFQDVDQTNALLEQANISYDSLSTRDKGELCRLLNVDAVITGNAISSKPMSDGAAFTMIVLLGGAGGTTNKTVVNLSIHNSNNDLLWKYDYTAAGGYGSTSKELTNALMKNASRNFPYKTN